MAYDIIGDIHGECDALAMVLLYQGLLDLMDRAPQR